MKCHTRGRVGSYCGCGRRSFVFGSIASIRGVLHQRARPELPGSRPASTIHIVIGLMVPAPMDTEPVPAARLTDSSTDRFPVTPGTVSAVMGISGELAVEGIGICIRSIWVLAVVAVPEAEVRRFARGVSLATVETIASGGV